MVEDDGCSLLDQARTMLAPNVVLPANAGPQRNSRPAVGFASWTLPCWQRSVIYATCRLLALRASLIAADLPSLSQSVPVIEIVSRLVLICKDSIRSLNIESSKPSTDSSVKLLMLGLSFRVRKICVRSFLGKKYPVNCRDCSCLQPFEHEGGQPCLITYDIIKPRFQSESSNAGTIFQSLQSMVNKTD